MENNPAVSGERMLGALPRRFTMTALFIVCYSITHIVLISIQLDPVRCFKLFDIRFNDHLFTDDLTGHTRNIRVSLENRSAVDVLNLHKFT